MEATRNHVLVVAGAPESNPALVHAVRRRAAVGRAGFTLLVPAVAHGFHRVVDPEDACCDEALQMTVNLLPALEAAAGAPVQSLIGSHEVLAAVSDAVNSIGFDEVIVSTAPARLARVLHLDLPRKIAALGVGVTAVGRPHHRMAA